MALIILAYCSYKLPRAYTFYVYFGYKHLYSTPSLIRVRTSSNLLLAAALSSRNLHCTTKFSVTSRSILLKRGKQQRWLFL